jgi:sugar/nucleoside kinase (ribokinase family)
MTNDYSNLPELIEDALPRLDDLSCVLGFDGTVDIICRPVQQRSGLGNAFTSFSQIREFGEHVVKADGKSALVELVKDHEKVGGNGPIMANALAASDLTIDYVGTLGKPDINPVYKAFCERINVHSIGNPAITNALEFDNGKVMLAYISTYEQVNAATIADAVGVNEMRRLVREAQLCCLLNWTCLPGLTGIFDWFLEYILPSIGDDPKRIFFFDFADPSMRDQGEITAALKRISQFGAHGYAVLGMNYNEVEHISHALGVEPPSQEPEALCAGLEAIRERLNIQAVMGHPVEYAACATADGSWAVEGPYTPSPKITTGAGDHMNAGFCLGLMLGFAPEDALKLGVLSSGFYVRQARPPALSEIPAFIRALGGD